MARYFDKKAFENVDAFKQQINPYELSQNIRAYKAKQHWYNLWKTADEQQAEQDLVNWFNCEFKKIFPKYQNFEIQHDEARRLAYALQDGPMSKFGQMIPAMRIAMQPGIIKKMMIGLTIASTIITLTNPFALGVLVSSLLMMLASAALMLLAKKIYDAQAKVAVFGYQS